MGGGVLSERRRKTWKEGRVFGAGSSRDMGAGERGKGYGSLEVEGKRKFRAFGFYSS